MAKGSLYTPEMIEQYTKAGYWGPMTLADYWERNSREYPHKEAFVDSQTRLAWSEAKQWMDRLALGFIELGFEKDEAVVIQLPNCVELVAMRLACERAGLLNLPVMRTFQHTEMEYILKFTDAMGVVIPWKYRGFDYFDMIQELRPNLPCLKYVFVVGDEVPSGAISVEEMLQQPLEAKYPTDYLKKKQMPALEFSLIGLTTGTTGNPKFVETPTCCRLLGGWSDCMIVKLTSDDIVAALSPAAQGPNALVYYGGAQLAAKAVLLEHWSVEEALSLIERERVTIPCLVPTQLSQMVTYPHLERYDLSSIRVIFCTGAAPPYQTALEFERKLGGKPVLNLYGAVDFGPIAGVPMDSPPEVHLLTVGHPRPGNEIKLLDESGHEVAPGEIGEIAVRGPHSSSGYYRDRETTSRTWTEDGWYRTGDRGKWNEQGYLTVAGRDKDIIIRGGQNIYPLEVENLLLTHPKVSGAAIVGIPDPIMGELACACVVPQAGQSPTLEELVSFLKTKRIAAFKLPEKLVLVDSLPYVGGLKLDRKALRSDMIQRLKA